MAPNHIKLIYLICAVFLGLFGSILFMTHSSPQEQTSQLKNFRPWSLNFVSQSIQLQPLSSMPPNISLCKTNHISSIGKKPDHTTSSPQYKPTAINFNKTTTTNHTKLKSILYWTTQFGAKAFQKPKVIDCFPYKCYLSAEATAKAKDFDALIFHTRDEQNPPKERIASQVYVAYTWESPPHRGDNFIKGGFYNWSYTYMKDSDASLTYGTLLPGKAKLQIEDLPQLKETNFNLRSKTKLATVTWIVSNCKAWSRRDLYVKKLQRFIGVDIYGGCGKTCPVETGIKSEACYDHLAKSGQYKFYLAFENSACKEYITFKPFRALHAGLIPIVLGGLSAKDYTSGILPPHSFIDVRNFTSAKHLAEYLVEVDRNETLYLQYHAWRRDMRIGASNGDMCPVCRQLYDSEYMATTRVLDWGKYWNPNKLCDYQLVNKVKGHSDSWRNLQNMGPLGKKLKRV